MTAGDVWAEAASLIADAGCAAEDAHRYRALAAEIAEPAFERALAIGSEVRAAARRGTPALLTPLLGELRDLTERCRSAIAAVRSSDAYREAARAYAAGDPHLVAELASAIFADVARDATPGAVFWSVPIVGRRADEHFLPAIACADRIAHLRDGGVPATTAALVRGGDDTLRPVVLETAHDESESPVALTFAPGALTAPVCRAVGNDVVLYYAEGLTAPFTVTIARSSDDEWWRVRPAAYHTYVAELRSALTARSIANVVRGDAGP